MFSVFGIRKQKILSIIQFMLTDEFHFDLPSSLIAQTPLPQRDASRLMVIQRSLETVNHSLFAYLAEFLKPSDVLVFNDTKVIKARLFGKRASGGAVEILLLEPFSGNQSKGNRWPMTWKALLRPLKRIKEGEAVVISDDFHCRVIQKNEGQTHQLVELLTPADPMEAIEKYGIIPLPPYIRDPHYDLAKKHAEDYQTFYASSPGAVAAPTAGRHFSESLLKTLKEHDIQFESITLHTGYGTFQPILAQHISDHKLHSERFKLTPSAAETLNLAVKEKRRIIAVGTTVARVLESTYHNGEFHDQEGATNLYIYPGYPIRAFHGLITNFHLPKSSLLLLVSAFGGVSLIKKAYEEAIVRQYRFYSFGDAMLILP